MPYGDQVIWPPHCVIGTRGAEFHKNLNTNKANFIIRKDLERKLTHILDFMRMTEALPQDWMEY